MKRIIALLLALALCCALCACGQEKTAAPTEGNDGPAASIPKPADKAAAETPKSQSEETPEPTAAPAPEATPEPTPEPTPVPTPEPPKEEIIVTDLCAISGKLIQNGGYLSYYSYTLPQLSGADTPWIREINESVQAIYDEQVVGALECIEEYDSLICYCISYLCGEKDGVHSLLITCDSDWGENYYWCYSYDDAGNKVENEALLKAAGLTPDGFVSAARAYLEAETDLSEYLGDSEDGDEYGWKNLQAKTISDENCNAEMPMAILPDGNLCFIATVYTPAGAGAYDYPLEIVGRQEIRSASIGYPLGNRIYGVYQIDASALGLEDDGSAYLMELFTVGDAITMEITCYDKEIDDVYYYYGADIIPEDPSDLLRGNVNSMRVRVLSWCPDIFGGTYYGEPGYYTFAADGDTITFSDFGGGTLLLGTEEGFTASYEYADVAGYYESTPHTEYGKFDYDAVEASGIVGIWGGYYSDEDYQTHSVTLELTGWGELKLRDCVEGGIPRVLTGVYYIAAEGDDMAPAGSVVFNLVARGGYKMPVMGYCYMTPDGETLFISEDDDSYLDHLTRNGGDYDCVLTRIPMDRRSVEPQVLKLEEGETVSVDVDADGIPEELSYSLVRDEDAGDAITAVVFSLNGDESSLGDQWLYDADVYLMAPGDSGQVFFYVDGVSDNDQHYTQIIGANYFDIWYAGDFFGGFAEEPASAESMRLGETVQLLTTTYAAREYRVGVNGMPEAKEPFFDAVRDWTLTAKQDVDCWIVTPDTGELMDTMTLPAGTKVTMLRTDGSTFWDLKLADGSVVRVWIDRYEGPQTIGGVDIGECFDDIRFAG